MQNAENGTTNEQLCGWAANKPLCPHSRAEPCAISGLPSGRTGGGNYNRVLMRPTPQLSVKTCRGGLVGARGGGSAGGGGGIGSSAGGSQEGGGRGGARPTTTTCIPQGCVCVFGGIAI